MLVGALGAALFYYIQKGEISHILKLATRQKRATVVFDRVRFGVEVVQSPEDVRKGLSGRDSIPEFGLKPDGSAIEGGMLFVFEEKKRHSFWMKDMRFPIDILWLNDGRVVWIEKNASPEPPGTPDAKFLIYTPPAEASSVLEIRSGMTVRFGINVGDEAEIVFRD